MQSYSQKAMLPAFRIICGTCWSVRKAVLINGKIEYRPIKPMTFEEISHSASRRSDKASERTYNNALEKMRKALCVK